MKKSGKEIIVHYLTKALLENGFVLLPGGGVFYLQRYPARIDNKAESIVPPGYVVDFVPSTYIADYFLAYYIAEKTNSNFHFWNRELKALGEELNNLESGEQFDLLELGVLEKDAAGNLHYESHGLKGIKGFNTLEVLPCKPIPLHYKTEKSVSEHESSAPGPPPISKKKEIAKKNSRLSILGWFLVILAAILLSSIIYDRCGAVVVDDIIDPPPHISEDRFNQPPEKLYVDSFQKEDSNGLDQNYQNSEDYEYIEKEEYHDEHLDSDTFLEDADENEKFNEDVYHYEESGEAGNDYLMVSGRCIIVTGSFSNQVNIARQSQLLENLGYSVYTENIGNLTRVGVLVNCDQDVLYSELDNLRANVEAASWIMENN